MRKTMIFGGILSFAVATLLVVGFGAQQNVVGAQETQTAIVQRTTLTTSVESTGEIAPERTVLLSFGASGTVLTVDVEAGDSVTAGQTLATLDTSDLQYDVALYEQDLVVEQTQYDDLVAAPTAEEIAQAEANLTSAQAQLQSAENSLATANNDTTLNCSGVADAETALAEAQEDYDAYVNEGYEWDATFIPDSDSEAGTALRDAQSALDVELAQCNNTTPVSYYETQVESARASVEQAQAALDALLAGATAEEIAAAEAQLEQARLRLENARAALDDAVIVAPFAGVVSEVNIVAGESANSNASALTLVDVSQLHVDVAIDENDVSQVAVGQSVIIMPDALEDTTLQGSITRISPVGSSTDGIVTYDVRIDLSATNGAPILVGMTTSVEIIVGSAENVLVVPTDAIQREGTTEFVQVLNDDGSTTQVNVTTGITIDGQTVIEGEISEGVQVVIPTAVNSTDGGFAPPFGGG